MRSLGAATAVAGIAITLLAASPAAAHRPPPAAGGADDATGLEALLGERIELRADGLYEMTLDDGAQLLTHGPDPGPPFDGDPLVARLAADADGLRGGARREPVCARDRLTRFALARPPGSPATASLMRSVRMAAARANELIWQSAIASGGVGADLKVGCDRSGALEVAQFTTGAHDVGSVVSAARRFGLRSRRANYLIFARAAPGDACGVSSFRPDDRATEENANRRGGAYAVIYGNCRGSAEAILHEVAHTQGAVQPGAPYSTGTGRHCWDELDVLCYSPDGGSLHQTGTLGRCPAISFDCGYDTYFDAQPEPGEYLATHWNLGSALNPFLRFGAR